MSRKQRSILARAAMASLYAATGDPPAGGGGSPPSPPPPPPPPASPPPPPPPAAKKIELTEDELKAKVDAALAAERDKTAKDKEKEKADREAEEAKKKGEFEKLYQGEVDARKKDQEAANTAKLEARTLKVKDELREFLDANHKDYGAAAKYMLPLITFDLDTKPEEVTKQIKAVAEQYVKDNPRQRIIGPPAAPGSKLPSKENPPPSNQPARMRPVGPASRF